VSFYFVLFRVGIPLHLGVYGNLEHQCLSMGVATFLWTS